MGPEPPARRKVTVLTAVLAASVVTTAIHYTDNTVAFHSFPGSESGSPVEIPLTWLALTAAGAVGYAMYRRGRVLAAHALLGTYALTGLTTPLHYLYGSPAELPVWRNVSILADGLIGLAVLAVVAWSWATRPVSTAVG
jgi:hypothetical protein